jgi:hypothetical protein
MRTAIDIRCDDGVWADLRITNEEDVPVRIQNPGDYRPTEGWEYSREAYQVSALRSLRLLEMTLRAADGSVIEPAEISTLADHLVGLPIALEPGAELLIRVPLHEYYPVERDTDYSLTLMYGDAGNRVSAATQVRCPAPAGPGKPPRQGPGA